MRGSHVLISPPRPQSSKPTKRRRTNTISPRKRGKLDEEGIAEVEDVVGADEGRQTTFYRRTH